MRFSKKRLPFAGLLLAAIFGIVFAGWVEWPAWVFAMAAAGFVLLGLLMARGPGILLGVACAFACAQIWQSRESMAQRLSDWVGEGSRVVTLEGLVVSEPVPSGATRIRFTLLAETLESDEGRFAPAAKVAVVMPVSALSRGDRVRIVGSLAHIPPPRNPGEFDARAWMAHNGVHCKLEAGSASDLTIQTRVGRFSVVGMASRSREWMERTLRVGLSGAPVVGDFLAGLVLGVTSDLPESLQREFRNTGTFHLFSVSGLHVGMIGLILWQALQMAGVGRRWAVAVIIPALFFYALITGWKPSSLRAAVMAAIFLIGLMSSRHPVPLNSLCAAGFLILVQSTNELFNPGFQLSFTVVAAILLLAGPIHDFLRAYVHPDPFLPRPLWTWRQRMGSMAVEEVGGLMAVSVAAWAGSLPLTLWYFHLISFAALPANLLIVPLAFLMMVTAVLALLGGVLWMPLAGVFNNTNWVLCKLLLAIVHAMAAVPGAFLHVGTPAPAPVTVTVFDFGAGACTGIETDGRIWLLDTGSAWQAEAVIRRWLHSRGHRAPYGILLTHGDSRHIGGVMAFLEEGMPKILVDSVLDDRSPIRARLHKELAARNFPKSLRRTGDSIPLSPDATFTVLYPPPGIRRDIADDKTLVVRLDALGTRILFVSDSGPPTLDWLLQNARDQLPADILVKGAHRSGIQMDTGFLQVVHPRMVITSAAFFPSSERLDPQWTRFVAAHGIQLFPQNQTGAVTIQISTSGCDAEGFLNSESYRSNVNPAEE